MVSEQPTKTVFLLNGPNLNLLGLREPEIYGSKTLEDIEDECHSKAANLGLQLIFRQSNHEGELVDWIQELGSMKGQKGLILNPGAYTHTSIALHDAILGTSIPTIELHLSNLFKREAFRHHSYISPVSTGMIFGLGSYGYILAIEAINHVLQKD